MRKPITAARGLAGFPLFVEAELPRPVDRSRAGVGGEPEPHAVGEPPEEASFVGRLLLPVQGEHQPGPPGREILDAVEQANLSVIDFLLQEVDLDALPRADDERLAAALAPLRIKLDMLAGMVARLSYRNVPLPPVTEIALAPSCTVWSSRQAWTRGDWLRLDLYFHPVYREPVSLFAEVAECCAQGGGAEWKIEAHPAAMPAATRERLARLVFQVQRRQQNRPRQSQFGAKAA